jgi:hypothetical protein
MTLLHKKPRPLLTLRGLIDPLDLPYGLLEDFDSEGLSTDLAIDRFRRAAFDLSTVYIAIAVRCF